MGTLDSERAFIEIDGSYGEGGGQILRTSLSLSCVTGKPVRIYNIRAGRIEPGLKPQHLLSAQAAARITSGKLLGDWLGSTLLTFLPGPVIPGSYIFDVSSLKASAGSTGLVFQTAAPPLFLASDDSHILIKGGTHVEWSPPADYIEEVFLKTVSMMGIRADFMNPLKGYYPIGCGEIKAAIKPARLPLSTLNVTERGRLIGVRVLSMVSNLPSSIAERQLERVKERMAGERHLLPVDGRCAEGPSPGKGTFLFILAEFENVRAGFSALGARGKKAETVADEASDKFLRFLKRTGALDPHLADQVLLFMALAEGESHVTTSEVTNHLKTNIYVIEKLLPVKFELHGEVGEEGMIMVKGTGFKSPGSSENQ